MRDRTVLTLAAAIIALVSARPDAGGWNDGSRLAAVECLVDHRTFAIDDSVFVNVPLDCQPYEPGDPANRTGTLDKLSIDGHFYSDKSPVPTVLMAVGYKVIQTITGLFARESPRWFCWLMTAITSGLAYVLATRGMHRIGCAVGLPRRTCLLWVISFAVGTVALAYSRTVNNHILLLGVFATLLAEMMDFTAANGRLWLIGALAGLGYIIDLGIGPVLLVGVMVWLAFRGRSLRGLTWFAVGALPWFALHHALNFSIAGTIGPANANPEYLNWPGSPFNSANMTGHWQHQNLRDFAVYSLELLFGQKGFVSHNQMLILAFMAIPVLLRLKLREQPELICGLLWSAGTFGAYAAASNNYSGLCVSVRWFVPLLAPAFLAIALLLRERPRLTMDFLILSAFGVVWSSIAWSGGPWRKPSLTCLWVILGSGQACWLGFRLASRFRTRRSQDDGRRDDHLLPRSTAGLKVHTSNAKSSLSFSSVEYD